MAKIRVQLTPFNSYQKDTETIENSEVGINHLWGSSSCGYETACGHVDTGAKYKESEGKITCQACLDVAETVVNSLSMAEINKLRKSK